ncbi:MAG: hypothetical protein QOJ76_1772 [Acidobacteriota bacterium]|jgi:hypothetical protein|nr:hypothetical protein [Acidobacteriota bacterium]
MPTCLIRAVTVREFTALIRDTSPVLAAFFPPLSGFDGDATRDMLIRMAERFAGRVEAVEVKRKQGDRAAVEYAAHGVEIVWLFVGGRVAACVAGGGGEQTLATLIECAVSRVTPPAQAKRPRSYREVTAK